MTIKSTELRITANGWYGIFISEEEAAIALAGGQLPDRILKDRRVSDNIRQHAREKPEFKQEILGGTVRLDISRWFEEGGTQQQNRSVVVEIMRRGSLNQERHINARFGISYGGRSYTHDETSIMIDALQLAWSIVSIANARIEAGSTKVY